MRADARRNREKVVAAARAALAEHGSCAQIDDIAARAGVGVGTVYRHFPTKDALVTEMVRQKFLVFAEHARQELATGADDALFRMITRNAELMAADVSLQQAGATAHWEGVVAEREALEVLAAELIARGKAAGLVREDMAVSDIPLLMSGVCASMAHEDERWRRHLELALDALRAR